jgi:Na+-transporting methylmalonyl-CoA/oxaloacetate decarboxylase gamma subunit
MKRHHSWVDDMTYLAKIGMVVFAVLGTISGAVWGVSEYAQKFAKHDEVTTATKSIREDLTVVAAQATTALDQQMEDLIARIAYLDRKPNKTAEERDQLKYLRDQLERLRRTRAGK